MQFMSWSNHSYPLNVIHPLRRRRFLGLDLSVPNKAKELLLSEYGPSVFSVCKTHYWNHRSESVNWDTVRARCSRLVPAFKFRTFKELRFLNGTEVDQTADYEYFNLTYGDEKRR